MYASWFWLMCLFLGTEAAARLAESLFNLLDTWGGGKGVGGGARCEGGHGDVGSGWNELGGEEGSDGKRVS